MADKRALLLAFGKWRVEHGMTDFLEQDVEAFLDACEPSEMPRYSIPALPIDPEADAAVSRYVTERRAASPVLRDLPDEGYGLECDWGDCGHTAVKERQMHDGIWLPVCACCAKKPEPSPHRVLRVLTEAPVPQFPPTPETLERIRQQAEAWHEHMKSVEAAMREPGRATQATSSSGPATIAVNPIEELLKANGIVNGYEHERTLREVLARLGVYPPRTAPTPPQRFWRVVLRNYNAAVFSCDSDGRPEWQVGPWHFGPDCEDAAREDASREDSIASGLPEWKESAQ